MNRIFKVCAALAAAAALVSCRVEAPKSLRSADEVNSADNLLFDGHRGLQPFAPENTVASFEAAGQHGIWAIETDFRMSSDGVVMCMHDKTLDRTTNGTGPVSDYTFEQLRTFRVQAVNSKGVEKLYDYDAIPDEQKMIPTMEEYFAICSKYGACAFVELKEDGGVIAKMNDAISKYGMVGRCIISSGNRSLLQAYRDSGGKELIHLIFGKEEDLPWLESLGNAAIAFNFTDYDDPGLPRYVELAHSRGIKVCFRAVDTPEAVAKSLALGIDYMPTNNMWPDRVR